MEKLDDNISSEEIGVDNISQPKYNPTSTVSGGTEAIDNLQNFLKNQILKKHLMGASDSIPAASFFNDVYNNGDKALFLHLTQDIIQQIQDLTPLTPLGGG